MAKTEDAGERALLEVVARAVQMARWEDGTSRRALAEESGLSERFIADVEKCAANPSLLSLAALGRALGMTVPELVSGGAAVHPRLARLAAGRSMLEQEKLADLVEAFDAGQGAKPPVALLGLRGAGKTTVGKLLAKRLGRAFVELDRKVEERAGLPLAQVFEVHGEPSYRQQEREALREVLAAGDGAVVATGGGIVSNAAAWAMLRAGTRTVWLKTRPEEYLARVQKQGDRRPMEKHPEALTALKALLGAREPEYRKAGLTVDTTNVEPEHVVRRVAAWLERADLSDPRPG